MLHLDLLDEVSDCPLFFILVFLLLPLVHLVADVAIRVYSQLALHSPWDFVLWRLEGRPIILVSIGLIRLREKSDLLSIYHLAIKSLRCS